MHCGSAGGGATVADVFLALLFLFLFFQETNAKLIKLLETDFAVPRRDRALTAVAVLGGSKDGGGKKVFKMHT